MIIIYFKTSFPPTYLSYFQLFNTVSTRKRLLPNAVPTLNLTTKTIQSNPVAVTPRRQLERGEPSLASTSQENETMTYKDLDNFIAKIKNLKLEGWVTTIKDEEVWVKHFDLEHALPKFSLKVNSGLNFSLFVYGWSLPDTHPLYKDSKRSIRYNTLNRLISSFFNNSLCSGVDFSVENLDVLIHTVPLLADTYFDKGPSFQASTFYRSVNCKMFVEAPDILCTECKVVSNRGSKSVGTSDMQKALPLKNKAPLSACSKERLVVTLQQQRVVCKDLESKVQDLKKEIERNSVPVSEKFEKDLLTILDNNSLLI